MREYLNKLFTMRTAGILMDALREIDSPSGADLETLVERLTAAEKRIEELEKTITNLRTLRQRSN